MTPTLCMIFEAIGPYNAIGKVAMQGVRTALAAGWRVTVVAKLLDESLHDEVEWLRLYVPPRLFFFQWVTARYFIQKALGNRTFDVIHAHQPQAAALSDVFQCHFLTRMAHQRHCLDASTSLRSAAVRAQQQGVLYAEDHYYRRWNSRTHMLYDSDLTQRDFHSLYGSLPRENVLVYAFPPLQFPCDEERKQARIRLLGHEVKGPVVGYLGGLHHRKGYQRLIQGMKNSGTGFLLMGGQYSAGFDVPSMRDRFKSVGLVRDVAEFYAACDIFAVPSYYEPLGLVAFEAAARGVPVIATEEVGALPHLLEYGAGMAWNPSTPLEPLLKQAVCERNVFQQGAQRMAEEMGERRYTERLLHVYESVRMQKCKVQN